MDDGVPAGIKSLKELRRGVRTEAAINASIVHVELARDIFGSLLISIRHSFVFRVATLGQIAG